MAPRESKRESKERANTNESEIYYVSKYIHLINFDKLLKYSNNCKMESNSELTKGCMSTVSIDQLLFHYLHSLDF